MGHMMDWLEGVWDASRFYAAMPSGANIAAWASAVAAVAAVYITWQASRKFERVEAAALGRELHRINSESLDHLKSLKIRIDGERRRYRREISEYGLHPELQDALAGFLDFEDVAKEVESMISEYDGHAEAYVKKKAYILSDWEKEWHDAFRTKAEIAQLTPRLLDRIDHIQNYVLSVKNDIDRMKKGDDH